LDDFRSNNLKVHVAETQWNKKVKTFRSMIYEETVASNSQQLGSFEFFELNKTSHQYMFTTLVDISSPHSSILYPQVMLEGVLRLATGDPEFEFKTRSTPFTTLESHKTDSLSQQKQFLLRL